jgi:hypothetical protein
MAMLFSFKRYFSSFRHRRALMQVNAVGVLLSQEGTKRTAVLS